MRSAKDMRGWMLFFVVWTAVDMIILQWIYETDKADKIASQAGNGQQTSQQTGQQAQQGNGQPSNLS